MEHDAVVVGAGLCGSVIARFLAEEMGLRVLLLERRAHIAGNLYDYTDENGICVQKYGPHVFHTRDKRLADYLRRFGRLADYRLRCMAEIDGVFTPTPFNHRTIDQFYAAGDARRLKERIAARYPGAEFETVVNLLSEKDPLIARHASFLFEKDYRPYTAKQWGIPPDKIDISVLGRVPVRFSYGDCYFDDPYQLIPADGFTALFERILRHDNITLRLGTDARNLLSVDTENATVSFDGVRIRIPVVFTGALDSLLDHRFGPLPYRSLRFDVRLEAVESYQPAAVVAYPQAEGYTRITEYKKLPDQPLKDRTVIAVEYPLEYVPDSGTEPFYPVPTEESLRLHQRYVACIKPLDHLFACGRLADFKYYNMDQALDRALGVCQTIRLWLDSGAKP